MRKWLIAIGSSTTQTNPRRNTSKWRSSIINCARAAAIVFLINLVVTILWSKRGNGNVLFDGDCDNAGRLNTGLHFIINALSTILLSSSNYCMQVLSAPTREEVDEAHAKGQWLDIGVLSIHNLRRIDRRRVVLWALLGISSLPLHLFYNSAIFLSTSANSYMVFHVRDSFISSPDCGDCGRAYQNDNITSVVIELHRKTLNNEIERLENADCIRQYAQQIQSQRRNLFLVSTDDKLPRPNRTEHGLAEIVSFHQYDASRTNPLNHLQDTTINTYSWMCSGITSDSDTSCSKLIGELEQTPYHWRVRVGEGNRTYQVDYCLSEKAEPHCKVRFISSLGLIVTLLNLSKATLILYTAFIVKGSPLLTMGDAVASFLKRRDETTKGMCLLSAQDVRRHHAYSPVAVGPKEWRGQTHRWKDATSRTRRLVNYTLFTTMLLLVMLLLLYGLNQLPDDIPHTIAGTAKLGYGTKDTRTIIRFNATLSQTSLVLVANIAQPILSFLYFSYNGLFTAMSMGHEWVSYATSRKGLRVSQDPKGSQRSTYFLQLPYRFALPLMVLSGVLHWLVSESIFLVAIDIYDSLGNPQSGDDWKSCGYSPIAIFTTLMVGIAMNLVAFGIGWVPYRTSMPVAGSCSVAISAACHSTNDSGLNGHEEAASKLQWGAVGSMNADGVGHCAFSAMEVSTPKIGQMYAG